MNNPGCWPAALKLDGPAPIRKHEKVLLLASSFCSLDNLPQIEITASVIF
jgi:hypothetical protein